MQQFEYATATKKEQVATLLTEESPSSPAAPTCSR